MGNRFVNLESGSIIKKFSLILSAFVIGFGFVSAIRNTGDTYALGSYKVAFIGNDSSSSVLTKLEVCDGPGASNYYEEYEGCYATDTPDNYEKEYSELIYEGVDSIDLSRKIAILDDYSFLGWCQDSQSCTSPRKDGEITLSGDTIFYAMWSTEIKPKVTLSFGDAELYKKENGEYIKIDDAYISDEGTIKLGFDSGEVFYYGDYKAEKSGSEFLGWCKDDPDCSSPSKNKRYTLGNFSFTLYAKFASSEEYMAYFDPNGGTWVNEQHSNTKPVVYNGKLSFTDEKLLVTRGEGEYVCGWKYRDTGESIKQTYIGKEALGKNIIAEWCDNDSGTTTPESGQTGCYVCVNGFDKYLWSKEKPAKGSNGCTGGENVWSFVPSITDEEICKDKNKQEESKPDVDLDKDEITESPNTGSLLLYVVYIIGAIALGYTGYYAYKTVKVKND